MAIQYRPRPGSREAYDVLAGRPARNIGWVSLREDERWLATTVDGVALMPIATRGSAALALVRQADGRTQADARAERAAARRTAESRRQMSGPPCLKDS